MAKKKLLIQSIELKENFIINHGRGGICSKGLSNLILLEDPENEFSHAQILLNYNEDFNRFKNDGVPDIQQDGTTPHTSVVNKKLIEKLFGENALI